MKRDLLASKECDFEGKSYRLEIGWFKIIISRHPKGSTAGFKPVSLKVQFRGKAHILFLGISWEH